MSIYITSGVNLLVVNSIYIIRATRNSSTRGISSTHLQTWRQLSHTWINISLIYHFWLVVYLPLWKIWVRQWEGLSHILWTNNQHVPNHQPDSIHRRCSLSFHIIYYLYYLTIDWRFGPAKPILPILLHEETPMMERTFPNRKTIAKGDLIMPILDILSSPRLLYLVSFNPISDLNMSQLSQCLPIFGGTSSPPKKIASPAPGSDRHP